MSFAESRELGRRQVLCRLQCRMYSGILSRCNGDEDHGSARATERRLSVFEHLDSRLS